MDIHVSVSPIGCICHQVRHMSLCAMMVVVSHDPAFLAAFAEQSLRNRLLVWATKLVVATRLALPQLKSLLSAHWTFSMMNTIFLKMDATSSRFDKTKESNELKGSQVVITKCV